MKITQEILIKHALHQLLNDLLCTLNLNSSFRPKILCAPLSPKPGFPKQGFVVALKGVDKTDRNLYVT